MKRILILIFVRLSVQSFSQDLAKFHLYSPEENAEQKLPVW